MIIIIYELRYISFIERLKFLKTGILPLSTPYIKSKICIYLSLSYVKVDGQMCP